MARLAGGTMACRRRHHRAILWSTSTCSMAGRSPQLSSSHKQARMRLLLRAFTGSRMVTLAKHRTPKVHFKVEAAAEHLASVPGATLQTAAKHCGLSVPKLRDLLKQPHNLSYVKQVRDLAIEALTTNGP